MATEGLRACSWNRQGMASVSWYTSVSAPLIQAGKGGPEERRCVGVEDRKEKHALDLQGEGRVYLYWV